MYGFYCKVQSEKVDYKFNITKVSDILDEELINPTKRVAICVTTNGVVKRDGKLVMGVGVAKQFRDRVDGIDTLLGMKVSKYGNHVYHVMKSKTRRGYEFDILSFPTKHDYRDKADINLIIQSAKRLVKWANLNDVDEVYIPSPGTGLGGLDKDLVYKALDGILDNRFYIVTRA